MYSREELDLIWKYIDHLDDRTFGDAGKRVTIMRLYSMGIPYRGLMAAYEGLNPNEWYTERIVAFGYDGVFHQAHNCPMYFTKLNQYGKTIKLLFYLPL